MLTQTVQAGRNAGAIKAEIGRMKTDGRLSRSPLKGTFGYAIFALLFACGHNIRKSMAHLRASFSWIIVAVPTAVNAHWPDPQMLRAA